MVFGLYGARDLLYLACFELVYCYCKIPISFFAVAVYNDQRNTLNVYMVSMRHKDCLNTASRMTHIRWVKKCKVIFQFSIPYVIIMFVFCMILFTENNSCCCTTYKDKITFLRLEVQCLILFL